jgi:hypothetical protein
MKEIILFGKALTLDATAANPVSEIELNKFAIERGYIVHPSCCGQHVKDFLLTKPVNYNSTFYKSFDDVTSKNRFELYIDQCLHYASTYGTGFAGKAYVPNDTAVDEYPKVDFSDAKVISPMTRKELIEDVLKMVYAPIALKEDTLVLLQDLIKEYALISLIDVNKITNKELLMFFCKLTKTYPKSAVECMRYLIYMLTESTLLIKDPGTIYKIRQAFASNELTTGIKVRIVMDDMSLEKLSTVFYRFKPLFLAMKTKGTSKTINKIRRLAKKNHIPMKKGLLSDVTSNPYLADFCKSETKRDIEMNSFKKLIHSGSVSNFMKIRLLNAISLHHHRPEYKIYTIRNGKVFVKPSIRDFKTPSFWRVWDILINSLEDSLASKACRIKLPENIELAAPTSEKMFVGDIPFNSRVKIDEQSVIGIHWFGRDGADDLDLSYLNINGRKFGWNSSYYDKDEEVVFSGDMTSANPEAAEAFYCKSGLANGVFKVNTYHGANDSKFTAFISKKTGEDYFHKSNQFEKYCVDPSAMVYNTPLTMTSLEMNIGFICDNHFVFNNTKTGDNRVSSNSILVTQFNSAMMSISQSCLKLEDVLLAAGFTICKNSEDADIDLSTFNKADLISLLSN